MSRMSELSNDFFYYDAQRRKTPLIRPDTATPAAAKPEPDPLNPHEVVLEFPADELREPERYAFAALAHVALRESFPRARIVVQESDQWFATCDGLVDIEPVAIASDLYEGEEVARVFQHIKGYDNHGVVVKRLEAFAKNPKAPRTLRAAFAG